MWHVNSNTEKYNEGRKCSIPEAVLVGWFGEKLKCKANVVAENSGLKWPNQRSWVTRRWREYRWLAGIGIGHIASGRFLVSL